ncbi:hypothetical protein BH11PAT4_BH11PAT4_1800 [soil metagenome]
MESAQPTEQLLSQWKEPEQAHTQFSGRVRLSLLLGGGTLSVLVIALGYWLDEFNFYIAAAVILMGLAAMFAQNRRPIQLKTVTVTNLRIGVDEREFSLPDLAGFWLQQESEGLVIMLEHKKPALIPVSFFFPEQNRELAQKTMLQVLPELEPRASHFTDKFSNYFRI